MQKKNYIWLYVSIVAFIALCGLAFVFQSIYFIYAASAVPIIIVLFMPDMNGVQWIKPDKSKNNVLIYKVQSGDPSEADRVIISFEPGFVKWNKRHLYFSLDRIPSLPQAQAEEFITNLSVLASDLHMHKRKSGFVGITIPNLIERSKSMPFTTNEVNRFTIRLSDLQRVASSRKLKPTVGTRRSLRA
ncbi:hypothetical protein NV379_20045 [Paenibacillus sp. N1-5-1-14]|uniref:hypothetical protein n=1 Tax=Paenibacillus radicibacter TaxID=2972488 RepID=UPI0021590422|nr:hypothetical protein [Paenibacillus radicibacter]MCR8644949.1 hypothetical protein [Paenibacillus radicibacter]